MHRLHLVAPLVIMVVAACWLLSQAETVRRLEAGNREMLARLDAQAVAGPDALRPRQTALDTDPRDWSQVAADLRKAGIIAGILPANG